MPIPWKNKPCIHTAEGSKQVGPITENYLVVRNLRE